MGKLSFASGQNKGYREAQYRAIVKKVRDTMNKNTIPIKELTNEDKLAYKAVIFGRFLDNEFSGKELSGIQKEFVDEFESIPVEERENEWRKLLVQVNELC